LSYPDVDPAAGGPAGMSAHAPSIRELHFQQWIPYATGKMANAMMLREQIIRHERLEVSEHFPD